MEVVQAAQKAPIESAVIKKQAEGGVEFETVSVKPALEIELGPQSSAEENRPADATVTPNTSNGGDTHAAVSETRISPRTSRSSEGAEVVTPAGTVEAPICAPDAPLTPQTEAVEKETVKKNNETETPGQTMEHESTKVEQVEQHETAAAATTSPPEVTASTTTIAEPTPAAASALSPGKKTKNDKKHTNNDSLAGEEVLNEVQNFLTLQIVENRCSSNAQEIHEFVEKHLNEKQRKRYVAPILERISQHFTQEAAAKGEEVSVDVLSNICLIEQMFLTIGRRSPLQDMYTAEEEEMLDLLFHSNSSDNLPING